MDNEIDPPSSVILLLPLFIYQRFIRCNLSESLTIPIIKINATPIKMYAALGLLKKQPNILLEKGGLVFSPKNILEIIFDRKNILAAEGKK